jgi:hypothetical protein
MDHVLLNGRNIICNEFGKLWTEDIPECFHALFQHLAGGIEEKRVKLSGRGTNKLGKSQIQNRTAVKLQI